MNSILLTDKLSITYLSLLLHHFMEQNKWSNGLQKLNALQRMSEAYHKAVKKNARLNVWDNNHVACDMVGVPIFGGHRAD